MSGLEAVLVHAAALAPASSASTLGRAAAEAAALLAKQAVERIARLREARHPADDPDASRVPSFAHTVHWPGLP